MDYVLPMVESEKLFAIFDLPQTLRNRKVEVIIRPIEPEIDAKERIRQMRQASRGSMKNEIWMADDFNAPLEFMEEYME